MTSIDFGAIQPLQRRMNLREALKIEAESYNDKKTREKDTFQAETVVRLYRKVEAALVLPVQMQMAMQHDDPLGAALDAEVAAGALLDVLALGVGVGVLEPDTAKAAPPVPRIAAPTAPDIAICFHILAIPFAVTVVRWVHHHSGWSSPGARIVSVL